MKTDVNEVIRRLGNAEGKDFRTVDSDNGPTQHIVLEARDLLVMWCGVIRSTAALYKGCKTIAEDPRTFDYEEKCKRILARVKTVSGLAEGYLDDSIASIEEQIEHLEMLKELKEDEGR